MGTLCGNGWRKLTGAAGKSLFCRQEPAEAYSENSSGPHRPPGGWHGAGVRTFRQGGSP